jgi:hypothetical protein
MMAIRFYRAALCISDGASPDAKLSIHALESEQEPRHAQFAHAKAHRTQGARHDAARSLPPQESHYRNAG